MGHASSILDEQLQFVDVGDCQDIARAQLALDSEASCALTFKVVS